MENLPIIYISSDEIVQVHKAFATSINEDKNGESLKAFSDWLTGGNYPITKGYFVVQGKYEISGDEVKTVCTFDITDIKNIKTQLFQTSNGNNDCYLSANIKIFDVLNSRGGFNARKDLDDSIDIEYLSITKSREASVPMPEYINNDEYSDHLLKTVISKSNKISDAKKFLGIEISKAACKHHAVMNMNALIVLMYHMAQNKPTYLTTKTKMQSVDGITLRPYKYDGYIDLRQTTKVYTVSTDKDGAVRKFTRHIESWSVRGHSRTYKKTGKTIWIGEQVRGMGALEQRTYATVDKSELDLTTKTFNVPDCNSTSSKKVEHTQNDTKLSIFKRISIKFKSWLSR